MTFIVESFSGLLKKYSSLVENNHLEAEKNKVASILTVELDYLQSCLVELFELGLITGEHSLRIIELQKDLTLLLETDPDYNRNIPSKIHYLQNFKRNLKRSAVLRCKLIAHSWLVLIDEVSMSQEDMAEAKKNLEVPFSRLLESKTGLFNVLQLCMDKDFEFDSKKADFHNRTKFHLLTEFIEPSREEENDWVK